MLATAALLLGCERRAPTPAASSDQPRIVALSPALTQIARDLDADRFLVGRHAFDAWADPKLPVCGDQAGLDYESLLATRPTHVLTQWGQRDPPPRLAQLARDQGWTVEDFRLLALDDIPLAARSLHAIAFPGQRFEDHPLAARLAAAFAPRPGLDARRAGRVLMLYAGTAVPPALGPGSWHHQLLIRLGGLPALTEGSAFQTLDAEDLARLAPDAIVLIAPRGPGQPPAAQPRSRDDARRLLGRFADLNPPALTTPDADGHPRLGVLDDPLAAVPGSNMATLADQLAELLAQWSR